MRFRPQLETRSTLAQMPGDPKDMTAVQARAAWDAVNADIARYNALMRGRTFVLPNEQAAS